MRYLATTGLLWALLLAGCAGGRPEWLEGRSEGYPAERFLIGQGEAATAAEARDRARADLVKVFETRVSEESRESATATRLNEEGTVRQSTESKAERHLSTESSHLVEGVRVAEMWRDDSSGTYHALAVLDRVPAAERLRHEIAQRDMTTERELAAARGTDDLLNQIAAAVRATEALRERETIQRDLRVVDPSGIGVPSRYSLAELEADLQKLTKRLRLSVAAEGDPLGNLATLLAGAVSASGFVNVSADAADYRLTAALTLDESLTQGWYWAKGRLEVKLTDRRGAIRSVREWPVKASAQQPAVARQRIIGEVDRLLRAQLRPAILDSGLR